jgi:hypothetical protein
MKTEHSVPRATKDAIGEHHNVSGDLARRDFLKQSALLGVVAGLGAIAPAVVHGQSTVLNVRDYGALGDGVKNDTEAFRKAIAAVPTGGTVLVPAGRYMLDAVNDINWGVRLKSNMKLQLQANAKLQVIPNNLDRSYLLWVDGKQNVEIAGDPTSIAAMPELIGDRDTHLGLTGEWGQGIRIEGSSGVVVSGVRILRFWGDGITVGSASTDVTISNVQCRFNRRQGLSIISVTGIDVLNSEFGYTSGTKPQAGIDIEPDPGREVRTVRIINCNLRRNMGNGIELNGSAGLIDGVRIEGCRVEDNGGYGLYSQAASNVTVLNNPQIRDNYYRGVYLASTSASHTIQGNHFATNTLWAYAVNDAPTCTAPTDGTPTVSQRHVEVRAGATGTVLLANTYCA